MNTVNESFEIINKQHKKGFEYGIFPVWTDLKLNLPCELKIQCSWEHTKLFKIQLQPQFGYYDFLDYKVCTGLHKIGPRTVSTH